MAPNDLLDGKIVLVSGVGPGLGRSCAAAALAHGASVALGDLDHPRLRGIAGELVDDQARVLTAALDITDDGATAAMVAAVRDRFGRVDGVVHVAALDTVVGGLEDGDLDDWDRASTVNVRGTLSLTRALLPLLAPGASIVIIGSIAAARPRDGSLRLAYGVSKGALATAARYLATELGPRGVRVNTVAPGWKWGPVLAGYLARVSAATGRPVEEMLDDYRAESALRDIASDDDVADTVVYFLSDLSKKVTGQTIHVDAGGYFH
jgi:NAD(P)-dependent dehydrogenase (short-subunit alcohol dehydrogenase family)